MESIPELLQTRKEDVLTWLKEGFQRGGSGVLTRQDLEIIVEHVREQFLLLVQDQYHAEGNRNLTIVEGIIESQANSVSFPEPNKTAAEKLNDIESRIRNSLHVVPDALKHRCLDVLNDLENSDVNTLLGDLQDAARSETDFDRRAKIRQLTSDIPGLQDEKERVGDAPPPSKTQALAREVLEALSWGGGKSPQKLPPSFSHVWIVSG